MNRERLLKLADVIENDSLPGVEFDMNRFSGDHEEYVRDFSPSCGTACCIGGYACLLFGDDDDRFDSHTASRVLDLTSDEAFGLFFRDYYQTRSEAAAKIRRLAESPQ